jgi:uncharacterized protein
MLPSTLLRHRKKDGILRPAWVDPASERYLARAETLVRLLAEAAAGQETRGELLRRIEDLVVGDTVDHRLTRGIVHEALSQCTFEARSPLPPEELRERLFGAEPVARRPGPDGRPTALDRFALLGDELGCDAATVARCLYADLEENQVLAAVGDLTGRGLLERYNIALVQGLLLHANAVTLTLVSPTPERARQVFRAAKFHQLMHRIVPVKDGYRVELDGPASLFSLGSRYGRDLALFFPILPIQPMPWRLEADVRVGRLRHRLVVSDADRLVSLARDVGAWRVPEAAGLEERFGDRPSGWVLEAGGNLVDLGGEALLVPDFTFRKNGRIAWLEIVGVWRGAYLRNRLDLLSRHGRSNLLLAVNRKLLGETGRSPDLGGPVLSYAKNIPAALVIEALERVALPES